MLKGLGHGIGFRTVHYADIVEPLRRGESIRAPGLEWLEVISENFLEPRGHPRTVLRTVREHFPIVMHGVSLSLGSTDPLNEEHLCRLSALANEIEPALVSDHLCWGSINGYYAHDLLPLPFTEESLAYLAERVLRAQDHLRRRIAIENVSSYLQFTHSTMPEWEFLGALCARAGCKLLLDVNNAFVSARNHGFDAQRLIKELPVDSVVQIHLAGHRVQGELYLDTHDRSVCNEVWDLYRFAVETHGSVATCVEWDEDVPALEVLIAESARAARLSAEVVRAGEAGLV